MTRIYLIVICMALASPACAEENFQLFRPTGNSKADQWQEAAADGYACALLAQVELLQDQQKGHIYSADHYLRIGRKCVEKAARAAGVDITPQTARRRKP